MTLPRRRSSCVYCGARISGVAEPYRRGGKSPNAALNRLAARVACDRHLGVALADPHFFA